MENSKNLGNKLADLSMESFTVTEMAVLAAIKGGHKTIEAIEDETTIKTGLIKNTLEDLQNRNIIIAVPGEEGETYIMKVNPERQARKYRFPGCLLLPVSSFHDASGQRWVTRGKWHKIDEDTDILNDIEWYDDMSEDVQMKSIMKQVADTKKRNAERNLKNKAANLGEAPDEIANMLSKWTNIGDKYKLNILAGGAIESIVTISPRIINEAGAEFPWGTQSQFMMSNEVILEAVKTGEYTPEFKLTEFINNAKKICAFKGAPEGDKIEFTDILPKNGKPAKWVTKVYTFSTGNCVEIAKGEYPSTDAIAGALTTDYAWFLEVMNIH